MHSLGEQRGTSGGSQIRSYFVSALQPKSDPQNSAHALAVCCFQTDQNSSRVSLGSFLQKRGGEKSNTNNKKLTNKEILHAWQPGDTCTAKAAATGMLEAGRSSQSSTSQSRQRKVPGKLQSSRKSASGGHKPTVCVCLGIGSSRPRCQTPTQQAAPLSRTCEGCASALQEGQKQAGKKLERNAQAQKHELFVCSELR